MGTTNLKHLSMLSLLSLSPECQCQDITVCIWDKQRKVMFTIDFPDN